jgi:hypothetical protein
MQAEMLQAMLQPMYDGVLGSNPERENQRKDRVNGGLDELPAGFFRDES